MEPSTIMEQDDTSMGRQTGHTPKLYSIPRSVLQLQLYVENPERDKLHWENTTTYIIECSHERIHPNACITP
jgi:hypothetical protein